MSARYEVGELVDVALKGVRVGGRGIPEDPRRLYVDLGPWDDGVNKGPEWFLTLPVGMPKVVVTRVAPKEWPPQVGDIWTAPGFGRWFARGGAGQPVQLTPESFGSPSERAEELAHSVSGLRLVYREGWAPETPGGRDCEGAPEASAVATTGQPVDVRAETIAGLRELAAWLEGHPEVPMHSAFVVPYYPGGEVGTAMEELRQLGQALGQPPARSGGGRHVQVEVPFRGAVCYRATVCDVPKAEFEDIAQAGEVAGPDGDAGPATAADETEHHHAGGAAGGPGEHGAHCACGYAVDGFDSQAEAMAALEAHIANPGPAAGDEPEG